MKHAIVSLHLLLASGTLGFSYSEKQAQSKDTEAKGWVEIHTPINDDFRRAFEARTSGDLAAWVHELDQFYRTDGKLVYRGVCNDAGRSLEDFLHMFVRVSDNLLSKGVGHGLRQAVESKNVYDLRRASFADFSRYNHDAYLYSIFEEVKVHQLGPVSGNETAYAQSYGFSTSWSFWMAAEFAGVYPGDESCANSMVFGMYPASYFIDYENLEAVDARFKRQYPDEREVLGVGAVDPDSLMLAARLEARVGAPPSLTEVLLRDPTNPAQVLYFEGGIDLLVAEVEAGWALLQKDEAELDITFREQKVRPPSPPSIPPDSLLRLRPRVPAVVRMNGVSIEPTKTIPLDYTLRLFPEMSSPSTQVTRAEREFR